MLPDAPRCSMKTLLIDNYDSFTFNLYQVIAEVNGDEPVVISNDQLAWKAIDEREYDNIVISPGPGRPERKADFGLSRDAILYTRLPLLGICLGHQGIGHLHGGRVLHAPEVMHGRLSEIFHNDAPLFRGIPQGACGVRYHSLVLEQPLPAELMRIAWTADNILMGLQHRSRPIWGVQFHPESICTDFGARLLRNFRDLTFAHARSSQAAPGRRAFAGAVEPTRTISVIPSGTCRRTPGHDFVLHTRRLDVMPASERVFVRLYGDAQHAFWLDREAQATGAERFSFMGAADGPHGRALRYAATGCELEVLHSPGAAGPARVERWRENIFDYLHRTLDDLYLSSPALPFDFNGGYVGYFGYALKQQDTSDDVHRSRHPDAQFVFADRFIAFDHVEHTTFLVCLARPDEQAAATAWLDETEQVLRSLEPVDSPGPPGPTGPPGPNPIKFQFRRDPQAYGSDIEECLRQISEGETYEVCLTNTITASVALVPLDFYRTLRRRNPAPKAMYLRFGELAVASSSPESFLRITPDGWVESRPIKGTLPRGRTPEDDAVLCERLRSSEKNRSENLMIVDLLRNDLGIVCDIGSVHVPGLMYVESYQTVHQLVSTVRGHLRPDMRTIDCVRATFPGGSMTGAPKLRTMQIIDALETQARGIYSGSAGYLALNGAADLNIVIRTAIIDRDEVAIGVGGAIVALSDPHDEVGEMVVKGDALMRAISASVHGPDGEMKYVLHGIGSPHEPSWPVRTQATPERAESPKAATKTTPKTTTNAATNAMAHGRKRH